MTVSAAGPAVAAVAGDPHPRLLRTPRSRWWRPPVGLLLAAVVVVLGATGVILAALGLSYLTGGSTDLGGDALAPDTVLGLLANNLVIAMVIPASVLAVLVVHRERPGWLFSVIARVRWSLLGRLLLLALAVVLVFFGLGFLLPTSTGQEISVPATRTLVGLLVVILLTTPLQSAAEEVGFRGYLTQAVSSLFARPRLGIALGGAVSATCFALAHGGQDTWLFADRFAFGVVASWLAWRTGGLEASVALHMANNLMSLGFSAATGSLDDSLNASTLEWQFAALDVVMMLTYAVLVHLLAQRWRPVTRRVLSAAAEVGYPFQRPPTPPPAGSESPWGMG